jgi:predicted RNA-binding protein with RPS1 domain
VKLSKEAEESDRGGGGGNNNNRGDRGGGRSNNNNNNGEKIEVVKGPPPEVGMIYRNCKITGVHDFGVFVEATPGHEGLVHITELDIARIDTPEKAGYMLGQMIDVKFIGINNKGQKRFSRRAVLLRDTVGTATNPTTTTTTVTTTATTTATAANTADSGDAVSVSATATTVKS